jgi:hypothetical protein
MVVVVIYVVCRAGVLVIIVLPEVTLISGM